MELAWQTLTAVRLDKGRSPARCMLAACSGHGISLALYSPRKCCLEPTGEHVGREAGTLMTHSCCFGL